MTPPAPPGRSRHSTALLAVLLVAPFLAQADATIANVATPAIRADLGASEAAAELVIGGYLVAYAVLLITGARLGQTRGYKRLFLLGLVVFGTSSLAGGLAPGAFILIVARVVQGAGAALMYPQALTGIQLNFAGEDRARAIGLFAIALAVPAALRFLEADERRGDTRLDLLGIAALSATLMLLVIPLILGQVAGWPAWARACLVASLPAGALFVATQRREARRGGNPLVNVGVISRTPVMLALLALLLATGTYYALLFTLAQYFQQGLGRGALASGLILVPWVAAFGIAGQISRRLPSRLGPILPTAGYLMLAAAYVAIGAAAGAGQPPDGLLVVLLALGGLGLGTGFATLIAHLTTAVPAGYAADISGVSTTTLQIGGALGVAAFGSLYFAQSPGDGDAFSLISLLLGATAVLAAAAAYLSTHARTRSG